MGIETVCVYASSSDVVDGAYREAAAELGAEAARRGLTLVYGGAHVGLMRHAAEAAQAAGGRVIGVIPRAIEARGIAHAGADELIITRDMRERKAEMERRADAFIALPGGFGTLEELAEILVLRQLRYHSKPVVLLNTNGFYDPLLALFEHFYQSRMARPEHRELYAVARTPAEALDRAADPAVELPEKWISRKEDAKPGIG